MDTGGFFGGDSSSSNVAKGAFLLALVLILTCSSWSLSSEVRYKPLSTVDNGLRCDKIRDFKTGFDSALGGLKKKKEQSVVKKRATFLFYSFPKHTQYRLEDVIISTILGLQKEGKKILFFPPAQKKRTTKVGRPPRRRFIQRRGKFVLFRIAFFSFFF